MLDQSSFMVALLIVGFFVFVTMKGELPKYRAVIGV